MTQYELRPWEHGPADECPVCSKCPVIAVKEPDWAEAMYGCLVCDYMVPKETLAELVLIRHELGTPNLMPRATT